MKKFTKFTLVTALTFSLLIPQQSNASSLEDMLIPAINSKGTSLSKRGNATVAFAKGNYNDAISKEKDIIKNINNIDNNKRINNNDGDAQLIIALAYLAQENEKAAFNWGQKAALDGNIAAQLLIAGMYSIGQGVTKNESKAVYWLNESKKKHKDYICTRPECPNIPNRDSTLLIESMKAAQEDMNIRLALGLFYQVGLFIKKNEHKARDLIEKPAKEGNAIAQLLMAQYYKKSFKKDDQKKATYWRDALNNNSGKNYIWQNTDPTDFNITTVLGLIYKNNKPIPKNNYLFNYLVYKFSTEMFPPLTPEEEEDRLASIQFHEQALGIAQQQRMNLMK